LTQPEEYEGEKLLSQVWAQSRMRKITGKSAYLPANRRVTITLMSEAPPVPAEMAP
jgi:hypothetical protein